MSSFIEEKRRGGKGRLGKGRRGEKRREGRRGGGGMRREARGEVKRRKMDFGEILNLFYSPIRLLFCRRNSYKMKNPQIRPEFWRRGMLYKTHKEYPQ